MLTMAYKLQYKGKTLSRVEYLKEIGASRSVFTKYREMICRNPESFAEFWSFKKSINNLSKLSITPATKLYAVNTLQEIADELGVTRQRVEQIQNTALRKAKALLQAKGFELDDYLNAEEQEVVKPLLEAAVDKVESLDYLNYNKDMAANYQLRKELYSIE